jgi:hypothetical protein
MGHVAFCSVVRFALIMASFHSMLMRTDKSIAARLRNAAAEALPRLRRPLSDGQCLAAALVLTFGAYASVLRASGEPVAEAAGDSARNLAALAIAAAPVLFLLKGPVRRIGGLAELAVHCALALLFCFLWFFVLMVLMGLSSARGWSDFDVRPIFDIRASLWQVFQGLAVYAALASFTLARLRGAEALRAASTSDSVAVERAAPTANRYFVRKDGDALPIDTDRIILLRGADDYSEIVTSAGTHLVRLTLARFEGQLDPARFCRIHRSLIVNIGHVERFEPDGSGRMLVWMDNGERLRSSRAGATLLRSRMI